MKIKCPNCESSAGVRIVVFGMPIVPLDRDKYYTAGCCIDGPMPSHKCINCGWEKVKKFRSLK